MSSVSFILFIVQVHGVMTYITPPFSLHFFSSYTYYYIKKVTHFIDLTCINLRYQWGNPTNIFYKFCLPVGKLAWIDPSNINLYAYVRFISIERE